MRPEAPPERMVRFRSADFRLHGILHAGSGRSALVICHPFADEKRCAHRALVETSRRLARDGWWVLRFDYRGYGDSEGDFEVGDLEDWKQDIKAAVDFVRAEAEVEDVGLLGLRLGATLAAEVVEQHLETRCLVLWEPITSGARYVQLNLRRSLIKKSITQSEGAGVATQAALEEGQTDLDGLLLREETQEQLRALDLLAQPRRYGGPTLVLSITARPEPSRQATMLGELYPNAEVRGLREQPFWSMIGIVQPTEVMETTASWLRALRAECN